MRQLDEIDMDKLLEIYAYTYQFFLINCDYRNLISF